MIMLKATCELDCTVAAEVAADCFALTFRLFFLLLLSVESLADGVQLPEENKVGPNTESS